MALIRYEHPATQYPADPRIDWSSPLARGLIGCWAPPRVWSISGDNQTWLRNLVKADQPFQTTNASPTLALSHNATTGPASEMGDASANKLDVPTVSVYEVPNGSTWTFGLWLRIDAISTREAVWFGDSNFNTQAAWGSYVEKDSGGPAMHVYQAQWNSEADSGRYGDYGKWHRLVWTVFRDEGGSPTCAIYADGVFKASASVNNSAWLNQAFALAQNTWGRNLDGAIAHPCVWDRALTDGEIALDYAPATRWSIFEPHRIWVPVDTGAPPAGTLSVNLAGSGGLAGRGGLAGVGGGLAG